jgi:hypothetical protein
MSDANIEREIRNIQSRARELSAPAQSYEEANWAKLSPNFRNAHNRLRQMRGLPTIPPPKIDLYVAPRAPVLQPFDPKNPDFIAATRQFLGPSLPAPGNEGFTINGREVR